MSAVEAGFLGSNSWKRQLFLAGSCHVNIALTARIEFISSPPVLVLNASLFSACIDLADVQVLQETRFHMITEY